MTQKIIQTIIQQLRKGVPSITVNGTGDFNLVTTEGLGNDTQRPTSTSRSFSTEYQNTNPYNLWVAPIINSDGTQEINVQFQMGIISGDLGTVDYIILQSGDISGQTRVNLGPVKVPPGGYYNILENAPNEATISFTTEWGETSP